MIRYPNGYIIETDPPENAFFVYGELNAAGYIAKGFRLDVPNLSNAGWPQKNELYTHLQSYLSRFDASKRLQFRYTKDSNYRKILEKYESDTERLASVPFCREFRKQTAAELRRQMEAHELWREHLTVYISRPAKDFISGALDVESEKAMQLFRERVSTCFESEYLLLKRRKRLITGRFSVRISVMFTGMSSAVRIMRSRTGNRRPLPNGITGCTVTECITTFWSCGSFRAST